MIELITWNVQSARTADGTADWRQVAAALRRCADAAIVCLQEVSSGFPARDGSPGGDDAAGGSDHQPLLLTLG